MKSSKSKTAFIYSYKQRVELEATVWQMAHKLPNLKRFEAVKALTMRDLEATSDAMLTMLAIELRGQLMTYSKRASS